MNKTSHAMYELGWTRNGGNYPEDLNPETLLEVEREDGTRFISRASLIDWRFIFQVSYADIIWWRIHDSDN